MPKIAKELSALQVSRLTESGHHAVGGVTGLYLYITPTGARSWVLRTLIAGKRRHMGLGAFPSVTLAMAREKARAARSEVEAGVDPIAARIEVVKKLKEENLNAVTFESAAKAYIDAHGDTWKNPKHRAQWSATLATYAFPVIGSLQTAHVTQAHVLAVLEPIWKTKNETAARLRGRIESVLDWATVRGYREGENPARWKGRLDKLLPAPGKIQKTVHRKALTIDAVPQFMRDLRDKEGIAARALEFVVLTAARSGEVRGATWSEIDLDAAVWVVPGDRMKAGREHRVPLCAQAVELLKKMPRFVGNEHVFPSPRGKVLSDMALLAVMRRMEVDAVPHGFRSTFRDWVGERTDYPRELAEQALAHTLESKVEAAYRRGDALEKRRTMMQEWSDFLYATK
ncbi:MULTISPECIES: site-specific integrase [Comamonas]|uniref:tyrosine-type recombinase/integrase n=1 Tax=Comamonas TaxID=283 RepID=UPI0006394992|nr:MULTISPECIES: site-specific integrase [Comamonas]MDH1502984.1 integrase arm-type DNA-binding domain-containing protein [Comamonas terrigena]GAO73419.1 putative integrase [Comamonas sp. E6]